MREKPTFWLYIVHYLRDKGEEYSSLLEAVAPRIVEISRQPVHLQTERVGELFNSLAALPDVVQIFLDLAQRIPLTSYTEFGATMRLAPNARTSMRLAAEFSEDLAPLVSYRFEERENGGNFHIGFRYPLTNDAVTAFMLGAVISIDMDLALISGKRRNISEIHVMVESDALKQTCLKELGITPIYNPSSNYLQLSNDLLDLPNPMADVISYEQNVANMRERFSKRASPRGIALRVQELINSRITDPPKLDEAASHFGMSTRQLRFALAKEGYSYRQILNDTRRDFAVTLLDRTMMPVAQIAYRLGYQEVTSFNHSFKRWTGNSPREFRRAKTSGNCQ